MDLLSYTYIDILIGVVLALIMFGIGLNLTPQSYKDIALHPKELFTGLIFQLIALPIIVFGLLLLSGLDSELRLGFIILAACPGATTAGFIIYLFRGNIALSVSLTIVNSLLALISIPLIINFASRLLHFDNVEVHLPYLESIAQIFIVTVIPVAAGTLFRYTHERFVLRIQKPLKWILIALLGIVFIIKFFAGEDQGGTGITTEEFTNILPWALIVNFSAFLSGYLLSRSIRINNHNAYTIGINIAMQNTTLAFLVAGTLLQNQTMVMPSLVYSMFSFWTAILFSFIFHLRGIKRDGIQ